MQMMYNINIQQKEKNMKKKIHPVVVVAVIAGTLVLIAFLAALYGLFGDVFGVKAESREYTKEGMTITLTDDFIEKDSDTQTAFYQADRYIVMALKEGFSAYRAAGITEESTAAEYGAMMISTSAITSEIETIDNLTCFTYEKQQSGKNFTYFASVYKGTDAFWLIQFACETDNYEDSVDQFITWAKSVVVS